MFHTWIYLSSSPTLQARLVARIPSSQARRMQLQRVWLPVCAAEPGPAHAKEPSEPGPRRTPELVASNEPGSRRAGLA
jgi:hypothetical protein